ncbi:ArsR/SmtB family transcription factor, partial [Gordonia sp. 852002-10350_SCH5691597]|uniref:ArsR/SmtB family transcription factor n=1 Tax=Gordonia sp. 852002-10350_SCH5691597 TaxID=1834085 RepID=UPI000A73C42D
ASDLLRALASPMRIAIVLALQEDARCVHELVGSLGVSQPLVSQHLRVLKDAGVFLQREHDGDPHGRCECSEQVAGGLARSNVAGADAARAEVV